MSTHRYALPIEETRWNIPGVDSTVAAVLTAVPFALIHMPLHFIGDFSAGSLATALVSLLVICVLVRLLIGVVTRSHQRPAGRVPEP